jgi:hypothetical protein
MAYCAKPLHRQVSQKGTDLRCTHRAGMPFVMKENEAFDPIDIGSFSANAVMFEANGVSYKIEEFRLVVHPCPTV